MRENSDKCKRGKFRTKSNSVSDTHKGDRQALQFKDNRTESTKIQHLQNLAYDFVDQKREPIQTKENNTGLPASLKSGIENLSGHSMNDVKVHFNSDKPKQLQAHAYAQGSEIHLGPGQEKHLPHEAWHVVQQKQGKVQPTKQLKKVHINDDKHLEKEADIMGEKAVKAGTSSKVGLEQTQLKQVNLASGRTQLEANESNGIHHIGENLVSVITNPEEGLKHLNGTPKSIGAKVVVQRNGDEVHNWDKVLCKYGSAGSAIAEAFTGAGYTDPKARRKAILKALRETGWGKSKIAHSLGGSQSKMRGGTIQKINKCQSDLIEWARRNPPSSSGGPSGSSGGRRRRKAEVEELGYDPDRVLILQLARWAREGDKDSLESLRDRAKAGNELAQTKLEEIEGPSEEGKEGGSSASTSGKSSTDTDGESGSESVSGDASPREPHGLSLDGERLFEGAQDGLVSEPIVVLNGYQVARLIALFNGNPANQYVNLGGVELRVVRMKKDLRRTDYNPDGLSFGLRRYVRGG